MRDSLGRFVSGSSGNPKGRQSKDRETKYLTVAQRACGFKDWREIVLTAVDQAKNGDAQARRWLSEYLIGKPLPVKEDVRQDEDVHIVVTYDNDMRREIQDKLSRFEDTPETGSGRVIDVY